MGSGPLDPVCVTAVLGGTFLTAASANSFNQLIEKLPDASMNRTARRPLPSGRISSTHARAWATTSGALGLATLAVGTNPLTAALGATTLGAYTLLYTPMKRMTPLNTWVGAVVGALPPVMGWTAAGGSLVSGEAAVLFASLFLWQMPHFFALAWMYRTDYAQGGYKMVPLTDPTGERTAAYCLEYSLYLALLPPACWISGLTTCMFPIESVVFNGGLLLAAWRFSRNSQRGQAHARRLFLASLAYLPVFLACLLIHQRRPVPVTMEDRLESEGELKGELIVDETLERIKARGRQLCIHEHLVQSDEADGQHSGSSAARCPAVVAESVVSSAQTLIQSPQKQPQQ